MSVVYFELLLNKPEKSRFSYLRVWLRSNWLSSRGRKDFFSNDAIKTFKSLSPNHQLLFSSYKNKKRKETLKIVFCKLRFFSVN